MKFKYENTASVNNQQKNDETTYDPLTEEKLLRLRRALEEKRAERGDEAEKPNAEQNKKDP